MHNDGKQLILAVRVDGLVANIGELEVDGERDAVRELLEALELLDVLEALQVQREHVWQSLDPHALMGLLQRAARVAKEFVVAAERLVAAKVAHACGDGGVLLDLEGEVKEGLVAARHRVAA